MAQTPATAITAPSAKFETVSITRSQNVDVSGRVELFRVYAGGRIAYNSTARSLLIVAYGPNWVRGLHQIDNAPEWVDVERFDIVAKAPSGATPEQAREMLQSLLVERFKLVAHSGSREFPIYALVLARSDSRVGPRRTASQIDCTAKTGASSPCGLAGTTGRLVGRGVTMAQLAGILPGHLTAGSRVTINRPVIDGTGLSGAFDFTLEWAPDSVEREFAPSRLESLASRLTQFRAPHLESKAPNFVAALREQLGLELDSQMRPEQVMVIDRIERPIMSEATQSSSGGGPKLIPMLNPGRTPPKPATVSQAPSAGNQPADFCCPDYISDMLARIYINWEPSQGANGLVTMKYTIARAGEIKNIEVERSGGNAALDGASREALVKTRGVASLPAAFPDTELTVHLDFQYAQK